MACLADYPAFCRHDLDNELHSPQARLISEDYAIVPVKRTHRSYSERPLAHYINDDNASDIRSALRHRPMLGGVADDAIIDRHGPFLSSSYSPRYRSLPHLCGDADHLDLPDSNWQLPYTYPLQCMEPGGVRWGPDQIHAYNRDVLRHNNQIARRTNAGVQGEYMMLLPMMDPQGQFPPGFDRPLRLQEFLNMDGKQEIHTLAVQSSLITLLAILLPQNHTVPFLCRARTPTPHSHVQQNGSLTATGSTTASATQKTSNVSC